MTQPQPQTHPTDLVTVATGLIGVTVYFDRAAFDTGWLGDAEELRLSVAAACNEVIGDDGADYRPVGTGLVFPPEPEGLPLHLRRAYETSLAAEQQGPADAQPGE